MTGNSTVSNNKGKGNEGNIHLELSKINQSNDNLKMYRKQLENWIYIPEVMADVDLFINKNR